MKTLTRVLSPFNKIKFEDYSLAQDSSYEKLVSRVFKNAKIENSNVSMTVPFPKLSSTEKSVWEAYCPNQRELKSADIAIHIEALGIIERFKTTFDDFEVWYESLDQIDPILIGKKWKSAKDKKEGYSWNRDTFILCRWGEALKPFLEIKKQVFESYVKKEKIKLQKSLNNLEFDAMERFGI